MEFLNFYYDSYANQYRDYDKKTKSILEYLQNLIF